jgi:large subunit ribosomal protein L21
MYAVIKTGGKQYQVAVGDKLKIELIPADVNSTVTFSEVLMVVDGENVAIGNPLLEGANVTASVINEGRHKKIRIFKMRRRKHYQKHQGHRQYYTEVKIEAINR